MFYALYTSAVRDLWDRKNSVLLPSDSAESALTYSATVCLLDQGRERERAKERSKGREKKKERERVKE